MTKVLAGITTSVDGYIAGPERRPGQGARRGRRAAALLGVRRAVDVRRRAERRADRRGRRLAGKR